MLAQIIRSSECAGAVCSLVLILAPAGAANSAMGFCVFSLTRSPIRLQVWRAFSPFLLCSPERRVTATRDAKQWVFYEATHSSLLSKFISDSVAMQIFQQKKKRQNNSKEEVDTKRAAHMD